MQIRRSIERYDRVCKLCNQGVRDELHFLFTCTAFIDLRETFIINVPVLPNSNSQREVLYFNFITKFTFNVMKHFCIKIFRL